MKKVFFLFFCLPLIVKAQIITTVAGNGVNASDGDGALATATAIQGRCIVLDNSGNLYIGENARIRKVMHRA